MCTALGCGNIIDIGEYAFGIAVVVLHGYFHGDIILFPADIYGFGINRRLVIAKVLYKVYYSAVIAVLAGLFIAPLPLILKHEGNPFVKVGQFFKALGDNAEVHFKGFKYALIRQEGYFGTLTTYTAFLRKGSHGPARQHFSIGSFIAAECLTIQPAAGAHLNLKVFAQSIYHRGAYAVQTT